MALGFLSVSIQGGAGLLLLGFSLYVFVRQRRNIRVGSFVLMAATAASWVLVDTIRAVAAYTGGPVHLISPVAGMLVVMTGWSTLNFALRFDRESISPRTVSVLRILFVVGLACASFAWHDRWAFNRRLEHGVPASDIGWPFLVTSGSAFAMIAASLAVLVRRYRSESLPIRRVRILYCALGIGAFTLFAYFFSLLLPLLRLWHYFYLGPASAAVFVFILFWAIVTEQIFNLRGALHKIALFFYQSGLIAGLTTLFLWLYLTYAALPRAPEAALLSIAALALGRLIYSMSKPWVLRRIGSPRRMDDLITRITRLTMNLTLEDYSRLCSEIVGAFTEHLDLRGAAFFRFEDGNVDLHTVKNLPGVGDLIHRHRTIFTRVGPALFDHKHPIVFWVEDAGETEAYLRENGHARLLERVDRFRKELLEAQIDIFMPVMYDKELMVVFLLGRKRRGEPFYPEEVRKLGAISGVVAVAMKNNMVYADLYRIKEDLRRENAALRDSSTELTEKIINLAGGKELLYGSRAMNRMVEEIQRAAPTQETVLILGESGTGKELAASMLHEGSPRKGKPFISVNCGAINDGLLQSELFGHEQGSFTGAVRRHTGVFEQADGGTLFLDEIGDMPLPVQVQMLRVLQERTITRIGGTSVKINVRIVAATNRNLEDMVKLGTFRLDLFYRLNVIRIHMPSLRERLEDVPLLVRYYLEKFCEKLNRPVLDISQEALDFLAGYEWPGNVRQLENVLLRAVISARNPVLVAADFSEITDAREAAPSLIHTPIHRSSEVITRKRHTGRKASGTHGSLLRENERAVIVRAMDLASGNKAEAARILGMSRSTFYLKLEKYGIT